MTSEYRRDFGDGTVALLINSGWMDGIFISEDVDIDNPEVIACIKHYQRAAPYLRAEEWVSQFNPGYWNYDGSQFMNSSKTVLEAPFDVIPQDAYVREVAYNIVNGLVKRPAPASKEKLIQLNPGFVYLLASSEEGCYKIGRTKDPQRRLKQFKSMIMPAGYECLIETQNMRQLEADLHIKFKDQRIQGEWFNLTNEDVEYIKGLAL